MKHFFNQDHKFTQHDIALLVGLSSDRQIRTLMQKGIMPKAKGKNGYDPYQCLLSYIAYKSVDKTIEQEAEVESEETEKQREQKLKNDERQERILLNRIKRLVLEKQYAPISIITDTISQVAIGLRTRVDSWLPKLKMANPEMTPDQIETLKRELAMALNELTNVSPNLSEYRDFDIESGFASIESIESDDSHDGSRVGR